MASNETNVSSDENTYNSINDCLNRLKTLKFDGIPLTIDENGKLKWNGSYEGLKDFVDKTLGLKGSWSSPGGYLKLFREASESIVIRHYTNTASFLVQGQKGELFTNILMHKHSNISSNVSPQTLMQSVTNDSVLDLSGFTLEPQGTPIHVGNVAAINRDLTSESAGIFKVHETVCDDSTNDVTKHISVCIVESPTSSKKMSEKLQSLSDSKTTYKDRYHGCLCQNQLTNEVNGLKKTISHLQSTINSFETTLKDHDSILYLYTNSTDLNKQYQREIAENKKYINILEQKLYKLEEEREIPYK